MDLNGLPQTVQNFINDTIQYRESGNCLELFDRVVFIENGEVFR